MRRAVLATGAVALVLALGACGSVVQGTPTAAGPQADTGQNGVSAAFSDANQLAAAAKAGTSKSKSAKFAMEGNLGGQATKASGQGRFDGDNSAMAMTMSLAGRQMEMRFLDKALYVKMPAAAATGKAWIKLSADGSDPMSKALGGSLDKMAGQNDPAQTLDQISKAGKITKSEQATVDGKPATHYTVDVDFAKLAGQQAPGGLPAEAADMLKGRNAHFPIDIWLNSDQLPVQIKMDMTPMTTAISAPDSAATTGMTMTMHYSDWGAPVDVQAPPADQVGDFSDLGSLGGSVKPTR
jgi:hypothetical protein